MHSLLQCFVVVRYSESDLYHCTIQQTNTKMITYSQSEFLTVLVSPIIDSLRAVVPDMWLCNFCKREFSTISWPVDNSSCHTHIPLH
jgi:hypothetical protein